MVGIAVAAVLTAAVLIVAGVWVGLSRRGGDRAGTDGAARERGAAGNKTLHALVWLLREPRYLDERILRRLASQAWGLDIDPDDPEARRFLRGESPSFVAQVGPYRFLINNFSRPYMDRPQAVAEKIADPHRRKAVAEHRAWLSVDLLRPDAAREDAALQHAYRLAGRLMAELADDDCLAVFANATGHLLAYDPALAQQLASEDPLRVLAEAPAAPQVDVPDDDPRMVAATEEARRRRDQFVAAFEQRRPDQHFAARAPFTAAGHRESLWLTVTAIEGDFFYGTLDHDPLDLPRHNAGDRVRVRHALISDWLYTDRDGTHGGFTIRVLEDAQRKKPQ